MTAVSHSPDRVGHLVSFATLGVLSTTQEIAGRTLASFENGDPEHVAEETLCLVATATARAAEVGLRDTPECAASVVPVLLELPFTYRDYLAGAALIDAPETISVEAHEALYERLTRIQSFYTVHLPPNQFPGELALNEKMALWMGRVSPPKQPELPVARLARLQLVSILLTHLRLVLAIGRRGEAS